MRNDKLHWYHFCLAWQVSSGATYKDVSCGFCNQKVTSSRMLFAKQNAGAPKDAMITSISYLGCMTREEFEG